MLTRQQALRSAATQSDSGDHDLGTGGQIRALPTPLFEESHVKLEDYGLTRPRFDAADGEAIEAQQIALKRIETRCHEAAAEQEAVGANPGIVALNCIEALRMINRVILDGQSVAPFLTLQSPGPSGAAPTSAPAPTPPAR